MASKRYQVFVSSTYEDLQAERREVMQALLELDCIPAGMELFPAANDDQWTLIKKVIDDCDYYIVIVGGRYGSTDADGVSYTEKEYRYALENGKPVAAYLHGNPGEIIAKYTESSPDGKKKLEQFRELVKQKMVRHWRTAAELGSAVSRGLIHTMNNNPAVGWVRADQLASVEASEEILRLRRNVDELQAEIARTRTSAPSGTADLAQGDDAYLVAITFRIKRAGDYKFQIQKGSLRTTWNRIFSAVAPVMVGHAPEAEIRRVITMTVGDEWLSAARAKQAFVGQQIDNIAVQDANFHDIMLQLRALGLIEPSVKPRSVKDTATYWELTRFGDATMMKLRAIRRRDVEQVGSEGPDAGDSIPITATGSTELAGM